MDEQSIAALAVAAGLSNATAEVAAAIAMAESGGNPNAHNSTPPDDSYGLWQINMLGALGPARRALYGLKTNTDLFDPATNARVMSAISKQGKDFRPWTTFTSGAYKQYYKPGLAAQIGGLIPGGNTAIGAAEGAVSDAQSVIDLATRASDALTRTGKWVSTPANWVRVAYVAIGGVAIIAGISAVVRSSSAGQTGIRAGKTVVKTAAKVAA